MTTTHANRHPMVPVWANPPGQITCHGVVVQSPQIKKIITVSWTGQRGNNRYSACRLAQPISFLSCTTPQLANWMMYNTICTSKTSRYDASEADTPVRVMAQRQRLHLTRGSNRSWVSTATVRHASGASVFCQRIVSRRCHVPVMFMGCPNSPQRVFSMTLASVAMFVDFSTRRSLYITTRTAPSPLAPFRGGYPPIPPPRLPLRMTGSLSGYKTSERPSTTNH